MTRAFLALFLALPLTAADLHCWTGQYTGDRYCFDQQAGRFVVPPKPDLRAWKWSLAAMSAAHTADIASSRSAYEANPLLRGADGRIAMGRTVAIKAGLTAGAAAAQWWAIKRWPRSKAARVFAAVNFSVAAGTGAVAARNWRMR